MRRIAVLAVAAALMLTAATANAQGTLFGAEVHGSFNTYSMQQVNDGIAEDNVAFGANFDEISNGFTGGINLRMWANTNWLISAGWEPLFASTESNATDITGGQGSPTPGTIELKPNAQSIQVNTAYFFPSESQSKFGISAGIGFNIVNGDAEFAATGGPASKVEIKGSSVGFQFMGLGEWAVSPGFGITAGAGYRVAKVDKLEFDGLEDPDSEVDYSGFMSRVGLTFYMPSSSNSGY